MGGITMSEPEIDYRTKVDKIFAGFMYFIAIAVLFPGACARFMHMTTFWAGFYGYTLFLGVPFSVGLFASLVSRKRGMGASVLNSLAIATVALVGVAVILIMTGSEGAACVFMAAPLELPVAAIGAVAGCLVFPQISSGDGKYLSQIVLV